MTFLLRGLLQQLNSSFNSIKLSFLLSPTHQSRRNYRKTVQIRRKEPSEAEFTSRAPRFLECHRDAKVNMNTVFKLDRFEEILQNFSSLQYGFI